MSDDIEEIEEEWDEVAVEIRRFAIEQAVALRASPSEPLEDIFKRANRIVDYIANGTG